MVTWRYDRAVCIDYRWEDRKNLASLLEATLVPLDTSFLPLSENLDHHHPKKKKNRSARRSIWRYRFEAGAWNCQILNQVEESQIFTSLWNRNHQWLLDIELNQTRVSQRPIAGFITVSLLEMERGFEIANLSHPSQQIYIEIFSVFLYPGPFPSVVEQQLYIPRIYMSNDSSARARSSE